MAEFERSLVQERVRVGLRNAKLRREDFRASPLKLDRGQDLAFELREPPYG